MAADKRTDYAVSRDAATEADSVMEEKAARELVDPSRWGIRAQKGQSAYAISRDQETEGDAAGSGSSESDHPGIRAKTTGKGGNGGAFFSPDTETGGEKFSPVARSQWDFGPARTVQQMGSFTTGHPTGSSAADTGEGENPDPVPKRPVPESPASGISFFSGPEGFVPPPPREESDGVKRRFFSGSEERSVRPMDRENANRQEEAASPRTRRRAAQPSGSAVMPPRETGSPSAAGTHNVPGINYNSYAMADQKEETDSIRETRYVDYEQHHQMAEANYQQKMSGYHRHYAEWKKRVWILPTAIIIVLLFSILIGAFLGTIWIPLFLLLVALGVVLLAVTGRLNWLKLMRKPKKEDFQMEAPELQSIHSVRVRLSSVNLSPPVEITIRSKLQIIGSSEAECREPLKYRGISRKHLSVTCENRGGNTEYFVTDLKSSNGTKLNGMPLKPYEPYPIKFGDVITLARLYEFKVCSDAQ